MKDDVRHYGLFTTVAMIVGIVIGSGIFFKTDNILVATDGNVVLGAIVFSLAATGIIFGCLTLKNFAALTDKPGGVITYAEEFVDKKFATAFGWFQTFIYYPTLTVVVSWVVGIYTTILFGWESTLEKQILIGFIWFVVCFAYNMVSAKIGGRFQDISLVIKMIPLISIGILGLLFGDPASVVTGPAAAASSSGGLGWLSALGPISFSFDGWIIATVIAFEVKNSKVNLPRALVIAPICVLFLYLIYFVGVSCYVGPENVIQLGDESVSSIAIGLFGQIGAKAILVFVVISVMGTVNGLILGFIRLPYSLALKGMHPGNKWLSETNSNSLLPINSALYAIGICLVWWVVHYFTIKYNLLANSDISEIAIAVSYLLYVTLYAKVFQLWRKGAIKGMANGVVFPLLAFLGSMLILMGALQNSMFLLFICICLLPMVAGYMYAVKRKN